MATTTTIYATGDTWMAAWSPTSNYGTVTHTKIGYSSSQGQFNGIFEFDTSSITNPADVVSAVFTIVKQLEWGGSAEELTVGRCTQEFTESGCTWNTFDGATSWTTAGGDMATTEPTYTIHVGDSSGSQSVDIKELVVDAINKRSNVLRILIKMDHTPGATAVAIYRSSEHGVSGERPSILITTATRIAWEGAASGNLGNALNWSTGGTPTANDIALFNSGSVDVTTGALTCSSCKVGKKYKGTIGSSSPYIEIAVAEFTLASAHAGMYVSLNDGVGTNTQLRITDAAANDTVHFMSNYDATISRTRGTVALQTRTVDRIDAHGRRVNFTADDDVAVIRCSGGSAVLNDGGDAITLVDANVTIDRVNKDTTDIIVAGSSRVRILSEEIADLIQYSGSTTFSANISGPIVVSAMTVYGGVVDTRTSAATLATVACTVYGGRLLIDASQLAAIA